MRLLACLFAVSLFAACQHQDAAEHSAQLTAQAKPAPTSTTPAPGSTSTIGSVASQSTPVAKPMTCGCSGGAGCGASCGGTCGGAGGGGGCMAATGADPIWAPLPADSHWTPLTVAGMHCGGCARRIERALAKVDGVLGVKADVQLARVEIATKPGVDARALVKTTIDGLGYQVQ